MSRDFGFGSTPNSTLQSYLEGAELQIIYFLEATIRDVDGVDGDDDTIRLCTYHNDITTNSYSGASGTQLTFTGAGDILQISSVEEVGGLQANGITVQISGLANDFITYALDSNYQNGPLKVFIGFHSVVSGSANYIQADSDGYPMLIFSGHMDGMKVVDEGETASITVSAESRLADFERTNANRYTFENQVTRGKQFSSGVVVGTQPDTALAHVTEIQRKVLQWGV